MTSHAPASRRRHAHLIATASQIAAEAAQAATAIFRPIAATPDGPVAVSGRELVLLAAGAAARLDHAAQLDGARWAAEAAAEDADRSRAALERAVIAAAEDAVERADLDADLDTEAEPVEPVARPAVWELTAEDGARLAPAAAVETLLGLEEAVPHAVREIAERFGVPPADLLADAATTHTASACLAFKQAAEMVADDPSAAAQLALAAIPSLVEAVNMASHDV